jgi:branched-chain amino acid transport system permease protein
MEQVTTMIINTLVLSAMYILVSLGFAFVFSMLGIINLAHGSIYMVGGYIGFAFIQALGFNPWAALLLSTVIIAAFGIFLEKYCFRPFVGDFNRTVMICTAITVVLNTTVNIIAGTEIQALPPFIEGVLRTGPVSVSYGRMVTFAIGAVLLAAIIWFVNRTKWGQQMQAIAQDTEAAYLQGINVHRISAFSCALGCGLAAIAGCLIGSLLNLGPFMGDFMLVKVLMVVILAGIGSIGGVFIAGLALGALNSILPLLTSGAISDAIIVAIVVVLLIIKPKGFFGHDVAI